jgi:hypothetical protein
MTNHCDRCGRFHDCGDGSAWRMVYSGHPLMPSHGETRCRKCVERFGPFLPQYGIKEKDSCGIVGSDPSEGGDDVQVGSHSNNDFYSTTAMAINGNRIDRRFGISGHGKQNPLPAYILLHVITSPCPLSHNCP